MSDNSPKHSYPLYETPIALRSDEAQHAAKRMGQIVDASFRSLRYGLRFRFGGRLADKIIGMIEQNFERVRAEIDKEKAICEKLLQDNGVSLPNMKYSLPATLMVENSTQHTARYYGLIQKLDDLILLFDTLDLSSVWTYSQRDEAARQWQRTIMGIGNDINKKEQRAWAAAERRAAAWAAKNAKNNGDGAIKKEVQAPADSAQQPDAVVNNRETTSTVPPAPVAPIAGEPEVVAESTPETIPEAAAVEVPLVAAGETVASEEPAPARKPARRKKAVAA